MGEEVSPWWGGQKMRMGYHAPCREEEGAGLLVHLLWMTPETAEGGPEEPLLGQAPAPCYPPAGKGWGMLGEEGRGLWWGCGLLGRGRSFCC